MRLWKKDIHYRGHHIIDVYIPDRWVGSFVAVWVWLLDVEGMTS